MDIGPDANLTRSTSVHDTIVTGSNRTGGSTLRDVTSAFPCGASDAAPVVCLPATKTGVQQGRHPFLFYARHGTFELYVGDPLMLVQTMTYGTYPVARAKVGFAAAGPSALGFEQVRVWTMNV